MKIEIAMYKAGISKSSTIGDVKVFNQFEEYIRVSEIVEVEFTELPKEDTIGREVGVLIQAIKKEKEKSGVRLESLEKELLLLGTISEKVAE